MYLKQDVIKLNDEDITRDSLPRGVLMMREKDADRLPPVLKRQERIENVTGRKAVMHMESMQPGDISRIGRECGYSPKTSVEEGIARFYDWYRNFYGNR